MILHFWCKVILEEALKRLLVLLPLLLLLLLLLLMMMMMMMMMMLNKRTLGKSGTDFALCRPDALRSLLLPVGSSVRSQPRREE